MRNFGEFAIQLRDVSLVRRTQQELNYDFKRTLFNLLKFAKTDVKTRTVLQHVNVLIRRGEKIGFIGANGSGKSTLLKVIAGILAPSSGNISVEGLISPLIELGVGFDPELSLVDNIVYYGVLLGHAEKEVVNRVDAMIDFAELSDHRDEPVKALSSGMAARLSFAVATEFRPDILLVDEVLSVGDERFRQKSMSRIRQFWNEHSTILFVSHDLGTICEVCDRVIVLDQGRIVFDGQPERACEVYLSTSNAAPAILPGVVA